MSYNNIDRRLFDLRIEAGLYQFEVAEKIFMARQTYGAYEKGQHLPSFEIVERLAKFYHVTPQYLVGWTNDRKG